MPNGLTQRGIANNIIKAEVLKASLAKYGATNVDGIPNRFSPLGTPVYDSVTFGSVTDKSKNNYIDLNGNTKTYLPFELLQVLVDVSMTKNIVSSAIQGKDGTIKQYISKGDYSINITGTISGKYSQTTNGWEAAKNDTINYFPEEELKALIDICNIGYHIPVKSIFLNDIFDVDYVVVLDYNLPQIEGNRNNQTFQINCVSDKENILEFTQAQVEDSEQLTYLLGV